MTDAVPETLAWIDAKMQEALKHEMFGQVNDVRTWETIRTMIVDQLVSLGAEPSLLVMTVEGRGSEVQVTPQNLYTTIAMGAPKYIPELKNLPREGRVALTDALFVEYTAKGGPRLWVTVDGTEHRAFVQPLIQVRDESTTTE